MKKYSKRFLLISIFVLVLMSTTCFAATKNADIVKKVSTGLDTIKSWIITVSTPAAAVAIGAGVLMKKFSFGDDERILKGKKLIRSTLFSYAFVLSVDLVLKAINVLFA